MYPTGPQYAFAPTMPMNRPMPYATGGRVASQQKYGLAAAAEQLRKKGREGDTVLAHISPEEAGILQLLGGAGTINPHTGLPEYKLRLKSLVKPLAATAAFIVSGGNPAAAAAAAAAVDLAQGKKPADAVKSAALTYVGASLGSGLGEAGASTGAAGSNATTAVDWSAAVDSLDAAAGIPISSGAGSAAGAGAGAGLPGVDAALAGGSGAGAGAGPVPAGPSVTSPSTPVATVDVTQPGREIITGGALGEGATSVGGATAAGTGTGIGTGTASQTISGIGSLLGEAGKTIAGFFPTSLKDAAQTAALATTAYGGIKSIEETKAQREAAERELAKQEAKRQEQIAFAQENMRRNPYNYKRMTAQDFRDLGIGMPNLAPPIRPTVQAAGGGVMRSFDDELGYDYARGGVTSMMAPRYLRGGGDGMSDSIPANIAGKQEARLADGEFVIPADVVSHIGNGSSNAGAKKLYAMMDRIRQARTGKSKQAPAINMRRLMPA